MKTGWRVAITRDEGDDGRLSLALRDAGLTPVRCTVAEETGPENPAALAEAARALDQFQWAIFASGRAVTALMNARGSAWPRGVRSAAVGHVTAAALKAAGADPAPFVTEAAGADALWAALASQDAWPGRRILFPVVRGGRETLINGLRDAGANVIVVEAYRMAPRSAEVIAADWRAQTPDAAVITSPSAARLLADAVGHDTLASLRALVAIGTTTARELESLGLRAFVSPAADFESVASHLRHLLSTRPGTPEPRNPGTPEPGNV